MERGPHLSRATTVRKPLLITLHSYSSSFPSKSQFNIVIIIIIIIVVSLSLFEKNVVVIVEKMEKFQRGENRNQEAKE